MMRRLLAALAAAVIAFASYGVDAKEKTPKQLYANEGGHYAATLDFGHGVSFNLLELADILKEPLKD